MIITGCSIILDVYINNDTNININIDTNVDIDIKMNIDIHIIFKMHNTLGVGDHFQVLRVSEWT